MIINPKDYTDYTEFQAAVLKALDEDGQIYVNKAEYDLDRSCEQEDYFINLLSYVDVTNENTVDIDLDENPFPGFEDYDPPVGAFPVYYVDGQFTAVENGPTYYNPGTSITLTDNIVGLNDDVPIGGLEVEVTLSFLEMDLDPISVTFVWIPVHTVTFPMLENYVGAVSITTNLPSAAAQPIFMEFGGGAISSAAYSAIQDYLVETQTSISPVDLWSETRESEDGAPDWFDSIVNYVVPDISGNGPYDGDSANYLGSDFYSADYRLLPTKHFQISTTTTTYNPALLGGVLTFNISKGINLDTYTYDVVDGDQFNPVTVTANRKAYADYEMSIYIVDIDGTPVQTFDVDFPDDDAVVSFQKSVTLDESYVGPLFAVATLQHAYNRHYVPAAGNTIPGLTFSVDPTLNTFEPGGGATVEMVVTPVAEGEYNSNPRYQTLSLSAQLYETEETTGAAVASESFFLTQPGFAAASGNSLLSLDLDIPLTYDKDAYWKFTVLPISFTYANNLDYAYPGTDVVQLSDIATVEYQVNGTAVQYWDPTQPDVAIDFVITPNDGVSLSDYNATVLLSNSGDSQYTPLTTVGQTDPLVSTYSFTPSDYTSNTEGVNFLLEISILAV